MTCNKCNTSLMDNFLYCPFCGQKQKVRSESEVELIPELGGFSRGDRVVLPWGDVGAIAVLIPAGEKAPPMSLLKELTGVSHLSDVKPFKQSYVSKFDRALILMNGLLSRYIRCERLSKLKKA